MLRSPENILGQSLSWFTKFNLNYILHRHHTRQKAATEGKASGDLTGLDSNITAKYKGDGGRLFWWCTVKERQAQQMQVPDPEFFNSHDEGNQKRRFLRDLGSLSLRIRKTD